MAKSYINIRPGIRDHDNAARVNWVYRQAKRYEDYWRPDIDRYISNCRFAWGLDFGQWPSYVVEILKQQGRHPPTFNVTLDKIESVIGSILSNGFDMKYTPMNAKMDSMVLKLQDMWYSDKYCLDWDVSEVDALFNSCVAAVGYERAYISDYLTSAGNIAYESIDPTHVWLDPGWKSMYVRDLRSYFTWSMMLPSEIMKLNSSKADRLRDLRDREMIEGVNYGEFEGVVPWNSPDDKWGSYHKVYEFHWVDEEEFYWEYDQKNKCDFPETGYKPGSDADKQQKMRYIQMMGLRQEDIRWEKKRKLVKKIQKIVPSIDNELILDSGKDKIQTNNINLYPIGRRYNGRYLGHVDRLRDLNVSVNKNEMNIDDIQARMAKGAFALDEALAGGDKAKKDEIESSWNDPAARIWVEEGTTKELGPHGGIIPLPGVAVSADLFHQTERRYELMDRLSKVSAAQDARTESSGEPARLFKYKFDASMLSQKLMMKDYESHKRNKTEAYPRQAKITYAGEERQFAGVGKNDSFSINRREKITLATGETVEAIYDDISLLPEMKVILSPSKAGINARAEMQDMFSGFMQVLTDPADRPLRIAIEQELIDTSSITDEKKQELDRIFSLMKREAVLQKALSIVTLESQLQQVMQAKLGVQPGQIDGQPQEPDTPPQQMNMLPTTQVQAVDGTMQQNEETPPSDDVMQPVQEATV